LAPEEYNWKRKRFKKNKVWVATDSNGNLMILKNKALIKYQLDQEHQYWVKAEKIYEISAETVVKEEPIDARPLNNKPVREENIKSKKHPAREKNVITIYTDGASSGNPGPSGIGVFMLYGTHERKISKYIGNSTNNIAELTAVKTALMELKRSDLPIRIYTDSSYVCGLLISGWKAKKNISLVDSIKKLMAQFDDIKIIKIKGHGGINGNERADQLATAAIASKKERSGS
jgi:ribonuclease HI